MDMIESILKGDTIRYSNIAAFRKLSANPQELTKFFSTESTRASFQLNFDKYGERFVKFMEFCYKFRDEVAGKTGTKLIGRQIIEVLVLLLDDTFDNFYALDTLSRIIIAGLQIGLLSPTTISLKTLATRLGEKNGLIEIVVSDQVGCLMVLELFNKGCVTEEPSVCEQWAHKLTNLCSNCPVSPYHTIKNQVDQIRTLIRVCNDVKNAQWQYDINSAIKFGVARVPPLSSMRKLNRDDRKTCSTPTTNNLNFPDLPEESAAILEALNLQIPYSARSADVVLGIIQKVNIPELLCILIKTYPCRVCNELSIDPGLDINFISNENKEVGKVKLEIAPTQDIFFARKIGLWKVLLSAGALKDIQRQSLAGNIEILEGRLHRLASGDWKRGNFSNILGTPAQKKHLDSPLLEAEVGRKLRIVWQINVEQREKNIFQQNITIWRIVDIKDVPRVIEHVVTMQRSQANRGPGSEFSRHPILDSSGIYIPSEFISDKNSCSQWGDSPVPKDPSTYISDSNRQTLEFYNKFYEFTKPVMQSFLRNNLSAEFPFDTSPEEIEVIKHDCTGTLILGRAGSGKTTVLVHKLLRNFMAQKSIIGQRPVRQILLTRSPILAKKLEIYTKRLVESQLLKMPSAKASEDLQDFVLGDENEMFAKSFCNLSEDDFPLVCTSDQLLQLIENTIRYFDRQNFRGGSFHKPTNTRMLGQDQYTRRVQVVDFTLFRSEYWGQFPTSLRGKHEPGLVFAEIMGIIKGFAFTSDHLKALSRDEYLSLSHKRAPTFDYEQRSEIYGIFKAYEKLKSRYGDRDGVDRVVSILGLLGSSENAQETVCNILEELYVDEVQDQRCLDIILLLKLIKNPRAIHFAGDTAQCISKDSTFRFDDVKPLFYRRFNTLASLTKERDLAHPVMYRLNKNYRTHQGIVGLASFVMKLLSTGFPETVDKMEEERGKRSGPIPTLFIGLGAQTLASRCVGLSDINGNVADFGAEQVILVRDEHKKAAIKDEIGDVALVLTILESKGMEFDDVFLLDFFASTPCGPGLRLLENIFEQHGQNQLANNALLCSELKHLYVAVTRPRNRLWMFESSPDAVKSIVKLFTDGKNMPRPLIEVVAKDHPKIQEKLEMLKPATSSDPKKYSEMGYNLLNRQLFKDAHFCFRKAKDKVGQKIAQAHLHMEEGRGERSRGNYKNFLDLFQKAVDLFFETSRSGNAAYCLEDMGKLEEAADVYAQMGKYEKAAVLYLDARSFLKASGCFDVVERYADAAAALRQGQMFDHLVNYLASNHDRLDPKVAAGYSKLCTILHKQGRISSGLEGLIVDTLGSDEEKIGFYEKCRLTQKLAKFRFIKHEYGLGFQVLVQDGKLREALDAALRYMNQCVDIPDSDVITVTNFMRFNDIHAVVDGHSPNSWSATDIQSASVADAFEKWDIFQTSVQNFRGRWAMVFPTLENDLHREVFSLLIATKGIQLCVLDNARSFDDLEYIIHALTTSIAIWGMIRNDDQELPISVAIFLGIFSPQEKIEPVVLDYSPFHQENSHLDMAAARSCSLKWLLEKMLPLYDEVHQKAFSCWKNAGMLCRSVVSASGCWTQNCTFNHTIPSNDECKHKIRHFRNMASMLCNFEIAHWCVRRNIVIIDHFLEFNDKYFGRRRRWLEIFLGEITFRNALEHDADAAVREFSSIISSSTKQSALLPSLEDLLFHRLSWKERDSRCDFSSMFEQVQLSQNLGNRVSERFLLYIYSDKPNPVIQSLRCMMRAFFCLKQNDVQEFRSNLLNGLGILEQLGEAHFKNFHAISGIYEKLIAFLFLIVCPLGCVFPMSWIKLHIVDCVDDHKYVQADRWQKDIYGECLVRTLFSFITVIEYVLETRISFSYGTFQDRDDKNKYHKRPAFNAGIWERNRTILVISLINLAAKPIPLYRSNEFFLKCQRIFLSRKLSSTSIGFTTARCLQDISMVLKHSFDRYNGKDSLVIVTRKEKMTTNLPDVLNLLEKSGVEIVTLQSLITAIQVTTPVGTVTGKAKIGSSSDTHTVKLKESLPIGLEASVSKIQTFWRKRQPYLISSRENLKTARGEAIDFVFSKIIKANRGSIIASNDNINGSRAEKIYKNKVLLTLAVDFYVEFRNVRKKSHKAEELSESVLENDRVRAEELQELLDGSHLVALDRCKNQFGHGGKLHSRASVSNVGRLYENPMVGWCDVQNYFKKMVNELIDISKRLDQIIKRLYEVSACTD